MCLPASKSSYNNGGIVRTSYLPGISWRIVRPINTPALIYLVLFKIQSTQRLKISPQHIGPSNRIPEEMAEKLKLVKGAHLGHLGRALNSLEAALTNVEGVDPIEVTKYLESLDIKYAKVEEDSEKL